MLTNSRILLAVLKCPNAKHFSFRIISLPCIIQKYFNIRKRYFLQMNMHFEVKLAYLAYITSYTVTSPILSFLGGGGVTILKKNTMPTQSHCIPIIKFG